MEHSPAPRFDLLNMDNYVTMAVQFSRGCPFKCEFCDVTNMLGRKVRTKTEEQVVAELEELRRLGWRGPIFFVDDNFAGRPARTQRLLRKIVRWQKESNHVFAYGTQVPITVALNDELLELMHEAGFWKVCIGFESTDPSILRSANKAQNTVIDFDEACGKINDAGMLIMATLMIGFDGESSGVDRHVIDFAVRNSIAEVQIFPLRASAGTKLWTRLQSEGRLLETTGRSLGNQAALMNFTPRRSFHEVVDELFRIYEVLFEPGGFLERSAAQIARLGKGGALSPIEISSGERLAAARALWLQAVVYESRLVFWRLFFRMMRKKKLGMFLRSAVIGACYFEFSRTVVALLKDQLASGR